MNGWSLGELAGLLALAALLGLRYNRGVSRVSSLRVRRRIAPVAGPENQVGKGEGSAASAGSRATRDLKRKAHA
jgi:hypothetical protein